MASWTLRVRHPGGQATLAGISTEMTVDAFLALLEDKTGVPAGAQSLLVGFPPKPLQLADVPGSALLSSLPLSHGESLTVTKAATTAAAVAAPAAPTTATQQPTAPPPQQQQQHTNEEEEEEDPELAMAIAASLATSSQPPKAADSAPAPAAPPVQPPTSSSAAATSRGAPARSEPASYSHPAGAREAPKGGGNAPAAVSVAMPDGSCVVRRVVPSDNSCLFASVGYVMQRSRALAPELRRVIARAVAADPDTYDEVFLGQGNADYCRWILDAQHWGGAIELSILCRHFGREIAAYDIQTCRCDVYGQDQGYRERVMLLYDGLHYDALAVAASEGAPEDWDVTVYEPGAPAPEERRRAEEIERAAKQLVESCHKARQFTDTANFTLRCGVCQIGLKGEKEAVEHAKATGHQNFTEY